MGTNYYLHSKVCSHCGKPAEVLHIGKSSAGWCVALHVYPDQGINDLTDWRAKIYDPDSKIFDEYGRDIENGDMMMKITDRGWPERRGGMDLDWCTINHAEPGPNGLSRSKIDGRHCIGHGPGTYDFIVGEFS